MTLPPHAMRGGRLKFDDYVSALGLTIEANAWLAAPRERVEHVSAALRDAFAMLPAAIRESRRRRMPGLGRFIERMPARRPEDEIAAGH